MRLIVGLGNPTEKYHYNRHNIGFRIIDELVKEFDARDISKSSWQGELYRSSNNLFLKPTTYMNLSGKSLQPIKDFFKVELENIIVIHDDIDLGFGALKFKKGGGNGGHNGLKSIDSLISKEYLRVRFGVGKPLRKSEVASYVLDNFNEKEEEYIKEIMPHILKSINVCSKEDLNFVKSNFTLKGI